jgi:citrate lyase subunit beta/citryl-CoA lyase
MTLSPTEVRPDRTHRRRRSKLNVIPRDQAALAAAAASLADVIQIEFPAEIDAATKRRLRAEAAAGMDSLDWSGHELWVRVDPPATGYTEDDVNELVPHGPSVVMMADAEGPADLVTLAGLVADAERQHGFAEGSIGIGTVVERVHALAHVEEIALSDPRMSFISIGLNGLSGELGYTLDRSGHGVETLYARSRCILAARLAGIDVGESPYTLLGDRDGTRRSAAQAFRMGFTTKSCAHPDQVIDVHQAHAAVFEGYEG